MRRQLGRLFDPDAGQKEGLWSRIVRIIGLHVLFGVYFPYVASVVNTYHLVNRTEASKKVNVGEVDIRDLHAKGSLNEQCSKGNGVYRDVMVADIDHNLE